MISYLLHCATSTMGVSRKKLQKEQKVESTQAPRTRRLIYILQGSVATTFRCSAIINGRLTANSPESIVVKEFQRSITIWRSCLWQKPGGVLFDSRCTLYW